jgi:hypothetical protein
VPVVRFFLRTNPSFFFIKTQSISPARNPLPAPIGTPKMKLLTNIFIIDILPASEDKKTTSPFL